MLYKPPPAADGSARCVKPCVRLGCLWEGSMPEKAGPIDPTWAANLETTIQVPFFAGKNHELMDMCSQTNYCIYLYTVCIYIYMYICIHIYLCI